MKLDGRLKGESFVWRCRAVPHRRSAEQRLPASLEKERLLAVLDHTDAGRIHEDSVAFASLPYLGITGYQPHAGSGCAQPHRLNHAAQRFPGEPLFEDEGRAEIKRPRPAPGEIVDRAVDC